MAENLLIVNILKNLSTNYVVVRQKFYFIKKCIFKEEICENKLSFDCVAVKYTNAFSFYWLESINWMENDDFIIIFNRQTQNIKNIIIDYNNDVKMALILIYRLNLLL